MVQCHGVCTATAQFVLDVLAQEVVADLDNQHNNITPHGDSAMEFAQPLHSMYWMFWLKDHV
jgi:hypothetical protein